MISHHIMTHTRRFLYSCDSWLVVGQHVPVLRGQTWQHMTLLEFSKVQHFQKLDLPSLVYYHSNLKEALIFRNSHLFLFQNLVSFLFLLA